MAGLALGIRIAISLSTAGVAPAVNHFPGGVLKTCSEAKVQTLEANPPSIEFGGMVSISDKKSFILKGLPFSAKEVWTFDGSTGRVFLTSGKAGQFHFTSGHDFGVDRIGLSCGPVQTSKDRFLSEKTGKSVSYIDTANSQKLASGDVLVLTPAKIGSDITLKKSNSESILVLHSNDVIHAFSITQGIDSPSMGLSIITSDKSHGDLSWTRFTLTLNR